jgi:ABC-type glycerol-3-phosphate transport system substrate-binding protein
MNRHRIALAALGTLALVAAGCGGSSKSSSGSTSTTSTKSSVAGSVTLDGVWTGAEAAHFGNVIRVFNQTYPSVKVNYKPVGDNLPTVLATAVAGGRPPDMADIAQPGLIQQFVNKGVLQTIDYAKPTLVRNFAPAWIQLGTFNGKLYGVVFKASNKSLVWYNVHAFSDAGVKPATTWDQFLQLASTVKASGTTPFSIGGADGWTLTDLFENIYLRTAGQKMYNELSAHQIQWTDPSVTTAMKDMAAVLKAPWMVGGVSGAVQTDFPTSVNNVFQNPPKGAMVLEGDFVPGSATVKARPGSDYAVSTFPSINGSPPSVEVAGDTIVTFRTTPAIKAFETFLATPAAAAAWARYGGFATGNRNVPAHTYPDAISQANEQSVKQATSIVFDMSDRQPGAFGATVGQGEWGLFQTFLRNTSDVTGVQKQLETEAEAAYKAAG